MGPGAGARYALRHCRALKHPGLRAKELTATRWEQKDDGVGGLLYGTMEWLRERGRLGLGVFTTVKETTAAAIFTTEGGGAGA